MTSIAIFPTLLPMVESSENSLPIRYPEFAERLQNAMTNAGVSIVDIQKHLKISYEMARRYARGQAMPRKEKLEQLADFVKSSPSYLTFGGGETFGESFKLPADKGNVTAWGHPSEIDDGEDRVWVGLYDYQFSAGTGLIQWEVLEKKSMPFHQSFFREKGVRAKDCKLLIARGRSMEPYLRDRDLFMVDGSDVRVRDGEVYAIYYEDEPLVKQIFKLPGGGIRLHSYNDKEFPDRDITGDQLQYVNIVGRQFYRSG